MKAGKFDLASALASLSESERSDVEAAVQESLLSIQADRTTRAPSSGARSENSKAHSSEDRLNTLIFLPTGEVMRLKDCSADDLRSLELKRRQFARRY